MALFKNMFARQAFVVWTIAHRKKYFGGNEAIITLERGHCLADNDFGSTAGINICRIKKLDALIKGMMNLLD